MRKLINESYFACFYYNCVEGNSYNMEVYEDRKKAQANFKNSKSFDKTALKKAIKEYKEFIANEFESLLLEKTAKEKIE